MITPHDIGLPRAFTSFRVIDARRNIDQFDIAYEIATSSTRYNIIGAPPGSGKTVINIAAALLLDGARVLYLVSTNQLLRQVANDFRSIGIASIIGRANYPCNDAVDSYSSSLSNRTMCNEGKCLSGYSCDLRANGCDYFDRVYEAYDSTLVLSNFAYRASTAKYSDPKAIGEFDFIICDEAHLLLDWMSDFCTIELDRRKLKKLLGLILPDYGNDIAAFSKWAFDNVDVATEIYRDKRHRLTQDDGDSSTAAATHKQLNEIRQLGLDLEVLSRIAVEGNASNSTPWIAEPWRYGNNITPIEPGEFLEQYIFLNAPRILLCSASITNADAPAFNCGDDYTFHQGGTGFPVENRPIIWVPTCKVSHGMPPGRLALWMLHMDQLIERSLNFRGVIHSVSYDRMRYIYEHSKHSQHMIIHRSSSGRSDRRLPTIEQALEQYYNTPPPVILVSPVVGTGYDFKYDRARWQIICKVQFLNPKSPIVKARKALWKRKYKLDYLTVMAAKAVLQMSGRSVRASDDWAATYVIDDAWGNYVSKSNANPMWFKNAMSTCWKGLPDRLEAR